MMQMKNPKGMHNTMVCIKCGNEQPLYESASKKVTKSMAQNLWCIKCKAYTPHKDKSFYKKETKALECNDIFGTDVRNLNNVLVKCTLENNLFFIFPSVGEAANFIIMNNLSTSEKRDYILNRIRNILRKKAQSVYGLKFSYVYLGYITNTVLNLLATVN